MHGPGLVLRKRSEHPGRCFDRAEGQLRRKMVARAPLIKDVPLKALLDHLRPS